MVLSRKLGERVVIRLPDGGLVVVKVLERDRGRVSLGVEAPHDCAINREEVHEVRYGPVPGARS